MRWVVDCAVVWFEGVCFKLVKIAQFFNLTPDYETKSINSFGDLSKVNDPWEGINRVELHPTDRTAAGPGWIAIKIHPTVTYKLQSCKTLINSLQAPNSQSIGSSLSSNEKRKKKNVEDSAAATYGA